MKTNRKRFAFLATTVAAVLVGGGVAVAYWTASGSGSGSASVGTSTAFDIQQTGTPSGLVPGGPAQPINFTVTNQGAGVQQLNGVTITVTDTGNALCDPADFHVTQPSISSQTINGGATATFSSASTGADISMVNTANNQNACKNASLTLSYSSN